MAAAVKVLVIFDNVVVGFRLPKRDYLGWSLLIELVRGKRFPTVEDIAQGVASHRPNDHMNVVRHHHPGA